jgi:TM2 domain-containing membrane protein YozV
MEQQKVDLYLVMNGKYFASHQVPIIRERLMQADDSKFGQLSAANFKDPTTVLIVSIVGGSLGIDRFMLGETGLGIAKLLTCGGMGIWTLVDFFLIMGRTRETNLNYLNDALSF